MKNQTGNRMRIGILGGTFDPIHLGHLIIAEQARDQYALDKVLLIPSGHSYFKDNRKRKVLPAQTRLEMTRIAAGDRACFEVSDIEVTRPGNTYSFETLEELGRQNPDADLFFIVGADTVCSMRTWREPGRIFDACTILAAICERSRRLLKGTSEPGSSLWKSPISAFLLRKSARELQWENLFIIWCRIPWKVI